MPRGFLVLVRRETFLVILVKSRKIVLDISSAGIGAAKEILKKRLERTVLSVHPPVLLLRNKYAFPTQVLRFLFYLFLFLPDQGMLDRYYKRNELTIRKNLSRRLPRAHKESIPERTGCIFRNSTSGALRICKRVRGCGRAG